MKIRVATRERGLAAMRLQSVATDDDETQFVCDWAEHEADAMSVSEVGLIALYVFMREEYRDDEMTALSLIPESSADDTLLDEWIDEGSLMAHIDKEVHG